MPLFEFRCPDCEKTSCEYHPRRPDASETLCACKRPMGWAGLSTYTHHVALVSGAWRSNGEFVKGTWGSAPKKTRGGTVTRYG